MKMKQTVPVKEIMTDNVVKTNEKSTTAKAAQLMRKEGSGCIIITKSGKPIGIITSRDILNKVVAEDLKPSEVLAGDIMSSPVLKIKPNEDVFDAARTMVRKKIQHLPVVEGGKILGIVSARDITAISPDLIEIVPECTEAAPDEKIEQSVCEVCGSMTRTLKNVEGKVICEECRDFLSK